MTKPSQTAPAYTIKNLDHLGLIAGMCKELQVAEYIDAIAPAKSKDHHLTHGQLLVSMILNGLGFVSRTLHMYPEYFEDKPIERLIGPDILAEHINDDALGRCLDTLYELGVSELYQGLAERVISQLGLTGKAVHLDITSFHVDGAYAFGDDDDTQRIQLVKGYSRDHRPELNQVILELITESQAGIPVYLQALNGNTNDQAAFKQVVASHLSSLKAAQESRYFVGDSALYVTESLQSLHKQGQLFVSRVPMKLRAAKLLVQQYRPEALTPMGNGYHGMWSEQNYAGVPQKWLLIFSEHACKRERKTLTNNIQKATEQALKYFKKLCNQRYACHTDAMKAVADFEKKHKYIQILEASTDKHPHYQTRGRPKKEQQPNGYEYQVTGVVVTSLEAVKTAQQQSGLFIIATNDCTATLSMEALLDIYKSQQSVERGFRFLKSPDFMTSSLYLKKPERIEALLMVMTCSLMIYAALEHRIRRGLKEQQCYFPDMHKKPSQTPTARWVFFCFSGIHVLQVDDSPPLIVNLIDRHRVILECLGEQYLKIYS